MRRLQKFFAAAFVLIAFFALAPAHAQDGGPAENKPAPHNGLWWHKKSTTYREGFLVGYKSAMHRANGHAVELDQYPASELLEGTDKFYSDFKNQNILVDDALHFVVDQVRGVNEDTLKAELLKLRAAAAPSGVE